LPDQPNRPPVGKEAVTSFLDSLSVKDGVFEVVVGQGRILTLKEDLAQAKKGPAMIAVGSPYVVDFVVLIHDPTDAVSFGRFFRATIDEGE
jgi:hypothetical protein